MLIQNSETGNKGVFFVEEENERLAEMDYSISGEVLTIHHTEVNEQLKGKNVGYQLVNHAAELARARHLRILPLCPFAKAVFDKRKEEYKDVVNY